MATKPQHNRKSNRQTCFYSINWIQITVFRIILFIFKSCSRSCEVQILCNYLNVVRASRQISFRSNVIITSPAGINSRSDRKDQYDRRWTKNRFADPWWCLTSQDASCHDCFVDVSLSFYPSYLIRFIVSSKGHIWWANCIALIANIQSKWDVKACIIYQILLRNCKVSLS